ncbi:hypothetical protein [Paenibacillus amylolyticus]|uniref:hypothetical protein n=1 Tax=Paenibacillus amylolyticus TaxID=1451 RepID=UPI003EBE806C
MCEWLCENFHSTRIRPWAIFYLFPAGVALHITIRLINKNILYPTVFHEEIKITKAVVDKSTFDNEFFNETTLKIKEEYVGDDEKLQSWNRDYIFKPNENDEWEFSGFSGTLNFSGEDYNLNYLELKR